MIDQQEQTYVVVECRALFATIRAIQTGADIKPHGLAEEVQFGLHQGLRYGWQTAPEQQADAVSVDLPMAHSMQGFRSATRALPGATAGGVVGDPFNTVCGAPRRDEHGRWIRPLPQSQWQQQPLSQVQQQLKRKPPVSSGASTVVGVLPEVLQEVLPEVSPANLTNDQSANFSSSPALTNDVDDTTLQEIATALESALNASCEATFNRIARERTTAFTVRDSAVAAAADAIADAQCADVCPASSFKPVRAIADAVTIEDVGSLLASAEDEGEVVAHTQHFVSPMACDTGEPTISVATMVMTSPDVSAPGGEHQGVQSLSRRRLRTLEHYNRPRQVSIVSRVSRAVANFYATASIKVIDRVFGNDDHRLIRHIDALAFLRQKERAVDEAQRLHWRALGLRERHYGTNHRERAINLEALAKMYYERGHRQEAAALYEDAVSMREQAIASERELLDLLNAINALAQMYAEQELFSLSEKQFQRALDIWNTMTVTPTPQLCELMHRMLRDFKSVLFSSNKVHEARSLDGQTYWLRRFATGKRGAR